MTDSTKNKLEDIAKALFETLKQDITSQEGRDIVRRAVVGALEAARLATEAVSPGLAVPFEELAFGWLEPKVADAIDHAILGVGGGSSSVATVTPASAQALSIRASLHSAIRALHVEPANVAAFESLSPSEKAAFVHANQSATTGEQ